ncbi:DUF2130 domain-containing protein [Ferruginibacter paludis]|uniref:DUF2130 domain-containing protein n=1 Tax=Ferruginibacter paludis TaxID=1310417 RepID=UPI0025B4ABB7|nr:DUF2130 domain-containing protein [Ferruginibacter paludis]MDN3655740.1 DUF2130 domain-containing protein [Ferruginibacter paludis]
MANNIKCPNCGHVFDVENVLAADIEQKYQQQYQDKLNQSLYKMEEDKRKLSADQQLFEEKKKKENELFAQKLQQEKLKLETEIQEQLRKSISADYENKLRLLQNNNNDNEEKLKEARKKELEFLQKEQQLKNREAELEITLQKKLQEERGSLTEQIRHQENEKNSLKETGYQLKLKELELQLNEQKKLADEMKRRAEQSSMQRQGEVQELLLEAILKESFPFDIIEEVGKGVEGADCIQVVRTSSGTPCGKIIYESKRTKTWSNSWVDKLKTDMRSRGADVAILVTQAFPKDMERFGEKDGIWICNFSEVNSVAHLLRKGILTVHEIQRSEENKGDKMQLLYNYLTGNEFKGQVEAIVEGFMAMKQSIMKERIQMEKMWKEREKQLEKVLISTSGMYGSVKGIAGASVGNIPLLDGGEDDALEE